MTPENILGPSQTIPEAITDLIEDEARIIFHSFDGDDTVDAHREQDIATDSRKAEYLFLDWLSKNFPTARVLYPCAGYDRIPSVTIGNDFVYETSLEEYQEGGAKFLQNSLAHPFIADNHHLPFTDSVFDVILPLDSVEEMICPPREEFFRVLKKGGLVAITMGILVDDPAFKRLDFYLDENIFERIPVPDCLQEQGKSRSYFYLFRKL